MARPLRIEFPDALYHVTKGSFLQGSARSASFIMVIGRVFYESNDTVRKLFLKAMSPIIGRFFEALCRALADIPRPILLRRLLFTLGAMGRTPSLTGHKADMTFPGTALDWSAEHLLQQLLSYAAAGMEAPCSA